MEGFLFRLMGDTRPDDEAALRVGLGGVSADLLLPLALAPPPSLALPGGLMVCRELKSTHLWLEKTRV